MTDLELRSRSSQDRILLPYLQLTAAVRDHGESLFLCSIFLFPKSDHLAMILLTSITGPVYTRFPQHT